MRTGRGVWQFLPGFRQLGLNRPGNIVFHQIRQFTDKTVRLEQLTAQCEQFFELVKNQHWRDGLILLVPELHAMKVFPEGFCVRGQWFSKRFKSDVYGLGGCKNGLTDLFDQIRGFGIDQPDTNR